MTKRKDAPSAEVRIRVMKRDRFRCTYCGTPGTDAELEIDHIHPLSKGGSHHMSNLTTACRACNQKKGIGTLTRENNHDVTTARGGLVGMFLHTLEDGKIQYQGQIIGTDGDFLLVELFSFLTGMPTRVKPILKKSACSEDCRLYANEDTWRYAYAEEQCRDGVRPWRELYDGTLEWEKLRSDEVVCRVLEYEKDVLRWKRDGRHGSRPVDPRPGPYS